MSLMRPQGRRNRSTGSHRVDIIVVAYRSAADLSGCLDAIAADRPVGARTIVVNNASPDESSRIARDHPSAPVVLESARNVGFGAACNLGAQASSAEFLFFLNPDARPRARTITSLVNALVADPSAAVIGPRIVSESLVAASAGFEPSLRSAIGHFLLLGRIPVFRSLFPPLQLPSGAPAQAVDWVGGAAMMVRATDFRSVGGFDPSLFLYMEDVDLCHRIRERHRGVRYDPTVVVEHEVGGSQGKEQPRRWYRAFHAYVARRRGSAYARLVSAIATVGLALRAAALIRTSPLRAARLRAAGAESLRLTLWRAATHLDAQSPPGHSAG
jgi:N-acetylglucosaminyl-diphospho-decaprenol L-rhamnosyltransferase